jgi:hypothetical protein
VEVSDQVSNSESDSQASLDCAASRRALGWLSLLLLVSTPAAAAKPDWVERHGVSAKYPTATYITGYGIAEGDDAVAQAKQQAAADLARKILVRIESEVSDVAQDQNGDYSYKLAAVTRSTTDIQVSNLSYEPPYKRRGDVYVFAWIDRATASRTRASERDRAIIALRACLAAAEVEKQEDRKPAALRTFQSCRLPIAEALQHDAVAAALLPNVPRDRAAFAELSAAARLVDREVESILKRPSKTLASAADAMAVQLVEQGASTDRRVVVSHFDYGSTNLSSSFGRQAGIELERAIAHAASGQRTRGPGGADLAVRGVYLEEGDRLRLSAVAHEVETGRLIGSAESSLPLSAVPERLEIKPVNFLEALQAQKVLSEGEFVSGELQVEVFTNKGRGGVLYTDTEELKVFMRVNRSAWIRLIYVLTNGAKVPLDQGYFIDGSKVNRIVEYPDSFTIQPPFGVEMLHATAFTEKPPELATRNVKIAGHDYEVIADGLAAVTRTRGLARKQKMAIAEDIVTVTTTPKF